MKKIIKLTENDLTKIVKKVINEISEDNKFGFGIIFAFPDYVVKGYEGETTSKKISRSIFGGDKKGTYGKLGHAGVILVDSSGNTYLFEFGRTDDVYGTVTQKNLGKLGMIDMKPGTFYGKTPKLTNAKDLISKVKKHTMGDGPNLRMEAAVVRLPNFKGAYNEATSSKKRKYNYMDTIEGGSNNCATFANDVMNSGGITNVNPFCSPFPARTVKSYYMWSDEYFTNL